MLNILCKGRSECILRLGGTFSPSSALNCETKQEQHINIRVDWFLNQAVEVQKYFFKFVVVFVFVPRPLDAKEKFKIIF